MPVACSVVPASLVSVALMMFAGCGHGASRGPAGPRGEPARVAAANVEGTEPGEPQVASQRIDFAEDDLGAGPATQVQAAPRRPPLPRFKLFGTREGDGPN